LQKLKTKCSEKDRNLSELLTIAITLEHSKWQEKQTEYFLEKIKHKPTWSPSKSKPSKQHQQSVTHTSRQDLKTTKCIETIHLASLRPSAQCA
jgi:hypothetical protein